jgi:uncharacterized protein (DUF885 family)
MPEPHRPGSELDPLEREVVDHLFAQYPARGVGVGLHQFDGRLPEFTPAATTAWTAAADRLIARLAAAEDRGWPAGRRVDRFLLRLLLESPLFELRDLGVLERSPMYYVATISLTPYLVREYAPAPQRARAILRTLDAVPGYFENARHRLGASPPRPFVELAIGMATGLHAHFDDAAQFAAGAGLGPEVRRSTATAVASVKAFADWLRDEVLPRAVPEFALGAVRFQRLLFVGEGVEAPFEEVRRAGAADLARNRARLLTIAREEATTVADLIERVNVDHPAAAELIPTTRATVGEMKAFVRAKDLVAIPEPDAVRVAETPTFGRALSTASMDSPGPFETSVEGVYYVTPVDAAWTPAQQEMWLRSLNRAALLNTTVHEVYPGHYLQFMHARVAPGSLVRKVYSSNSFVEGWAHYTEQLAIEAGLGAPRREAEVVQILDALLRDCRLLSAIGLHTEGWSVERSSELFQREAHLERLPADREALRGTFDPVYFCYTLGKLAILNARAKTLESQFGGSLRRFHDTLLASGAPPVGLLETLLESASPPA